MNFKIVSEYQTFVNEFLSRSDIMAKDYFAFVNVIKNKKAIENAILGKNCKFYSQKKHYGYEIKHNDNYFEFKYYFTDENNQKVEKYRILFWHKVIENYLNLLINNKLHSKIPGNKKATHLDNLVPIFIFEIKDNKKQKYCDYFITLADKDLKDELLVITKNNYANQTLNKTIISKSEIDFFKLIEKANNDINYKDIKEDENEDKKQDDFQFFTF